jgi:acetyltransferase-like isoleucine patch superfamily enzyme
MPYLTPEEIATMGFGHVGQRARLSARASYYNCANIHVGDDVRIDDFCVLSAGAGGIDIGSNVHVAVFGCLIGRGKIRVGDFANLSSRVSIYSSSDDYSGAAMTNPTIPEEFTNVFHADVEVGRHVIVGSGSIVLPGIVIEEGVAIGAMSLIKRRCEAFGVYAGTPARRVAERKRTLLEIEQRFRERARDPQ